MAVLADGRSGVGRWATNGNFTNCIKKLYLSFVPLQNLFIVKIVDGEKFDTLKECNRTTIEGVEQSF